MLSSAKYTNPHYKPGHLFDTLQRLFRVKNDRQLANRLDVPPPLLWKKPGSKGRYSAWLLIHLNEGTNFSIRELRALMETTDRIAASRPDTQRLSSFPLRGLCG